MAESEPITVGEYVWWWVRKRGQKFSIRRYGQVVRMNKEGTIALVDTNSGYPALQTVEVKRLFIQARNT